MLSYILTGLALLTAVLGARDDDGFHHKNHSTKTHCPPIKTHCPVPFMPCRQQEQQHPQEERIDVLDTYHPSNVFQPVNQFDKLCNGGGCDHNNGNYIDHDNYNNYNNYDDENIFDFENRFSGCGRHECNGCHECDRFEDQHEGHREFDEIKHNFGATNFDLN